MRRRRSGSCICSWPAHRAISSCSTTSRSWPSTTASRRRPSLIRDYRAAFINPNAKFLGPKFKFAKHGQCGAELAELLPGLAEVVDDIAIVKSMVTDAFNHAPAQILMNTGSIAVRPAQLRVVGHVRLGSESRICPASSCSIRARRARAAATRISAAAFCRRSITACPSAAAASRCCIFEPARSRCQACSATRSMPSRSSIASGSATVGDPEIATRINSFEMAYRMQSSAPELMDLGQEPKSILEMYGAEPGKASFANNCLLARRMLERGVRFVQLFHEAWDQHGNLTNDLKQNCKDCDRRFGGAGEGLEAARAARRYDRAVGRRIRPHADGRRRRQRRPRSSSQRLHLLAGRRRDQAGPDARHLRRIRLQRRRGSRARPRPARHACCICSASTTPSSRSASKAAISALTDVHGTLVKKLLA